MFVLPFFLNWLDLTALFVMGICAVDGLMKGLVKSFFSIASVIISLIAARTMAHPVSEYLYKNTALDESLNKYFLERTPHFNSYVTSALNIMGDKSSQVGNLLTSTFISLISFVVVFILSMFVLNIFAAMIDTAAKFPVLKQFNKLGGFGIGILKGAAILYIVFALLSPILPSLSSSNPIIAALDSSLFAVNFYRYNFILYWISSM